MTKVDQNSAKLTPNNVSTISGQYFDLSEPFAPPRYGNQCTPFITGREYLKAVANAIRGAEKFIFIADWQLDYDVELDNRGVAGHPGRLSELLAEAIKKGIHVRILCYDSVDTVGKVGISGPPDTHEEEAQSVLENLPKGKGSIKVMLQNQNTGRSAVKGELGVLFSHHQKFVVVDGRLAFLGGYDLAWGRWETPTFDVVVDPKIHVLNDAYNQQITPSRTATVDEMTLTNTQKKGHPGFAKPHYTTNKKLLDPATQPRQPWEDVAVGIEGPAAFDVFVNFVLRWNSFASSGSNVADMPLTIGWFEGAKGQSTLVDPLKKGEGTASVQICRSASSTQLNDELPLWNTAHKYVHDDWKQDNPKRRAVMESARKKWAANHQTSIRDAMINSIRSAKAFIYIENQFFISSCGKDSRGSPSPANNQILAELATKIGQAIYSNQPFHVWLVLPEHPEGMLEGEPTSSQAWWAMQGVKHAQNSLIHRINATLLEKNKKTWGVVKPLRTNAEITAILKLHSMDNAWRDYLTVLNLRNYGHSQTSVLTEMVYVHSKLLIVDDAVVILGSANINDRSLNGDGDTELSAVIVDDANAEMTDVGQGVSVVTRKFARNLRIMIWKKHLGMLVDSTTTGVQKESAPPMGINIDQPLNKNSITGIFGLSIKNRQAYNRVFIHTPRNDFGSLLDGRRRYPHLTKKVKKYSVNGVEIGNVSPDGQLRDPFIMVDEPTSGYDFAKLPPLHPKFMRGTQHDVSAAIKELRASIKGFFVEAPLDWGIKEKTTPKYPLTGPQTIALNESSNDQGNASGRNS